jgi:hypothetical protein
VVCKENKKGAKIKANAIKRQMLRNEIACNFLGDIMISGMDLENWMYGVNVKGNLRIHIPFNSMKNSQ